MDEIEHLSVEELKEIAVKYFDKIQYARDKAKEFYKNNTEYCNQKSIVKYYDAQHKTLPGAVRSGTYYTQEEDKFILENLELGTEMLARASLTILNACFYGFLILATILIFLPVVRDISNFIWGSLF